MRAVVTELAAQYLPKRGTVLDLGCSRGEALVRVIAAAGGQARGVGVELSEPMAAAARARGVDVVSADLRTQFPALRDVDVVLAVLTLQFIPIEHRARVVQKSYDALRDGGAMLVVEKVLGATETTGRPMIEAHDQRKRELGYSDEEITRNLLALEGVLVPVTAAWNEDMLRAAGFRYVECAWRCLNFAGWLAVR
jgi:tRNA (cmo5U34)-methyltransferase